MRDARMPSPDWRAEFDVHGWLVLRAVVSDRQLAELNGIFDELMMPVAAPSGGSRTGLVQRAGVCRTHEVLLRHLHEGMAAVACDLLGARSVQLLQDALLLKHPSSAGSVALHQDYSYTGYLDPPCSLAIGLALNDATQKSGCLHVVDGSHAWGLVNGFHVLADQLQTDLPARLSPAQRAHVDRATIPLEVRAGDVTIHHCLTLHGSGDNRSNRPRKTIVAHLFSGDCTLVPDRVPSHARALFATDDSGRLALAAFPRLYPS